MRRLSVPLLVVALLALLIPVALADGGCPYRGACLEYRGPEPVYWPYDAETGKVIPLQRGMDHPFVPVVRAMMYAHGFGGINQLTSTVYDDALARRVARFQWVWMRGYEPWYPFTYGEYWTPTHVFAAGFIRVNLQGAP